jgi:hypothetical protein
MGWLSNFADEDRATARLLLDALRIASEGDIPAGLLHNLNELVAELPGPILLLPVRDLADIDRHWQANLPTVYQDFPPHTDFGPTPGSEAVVANLLRDIIGIRGSRTGVLSPDVSLRRLRREKCRILLFVGDYAGSGLQALSYLRSWLRNPTVRSWRSFGWTKVHLLLFAASGFAAGRLRSSGTVDHLHIIERAADFGSAPWSRGKEEEVAELCIRYAEPKRLRRGEALGFAGSRGLFLMPHTVPNNLPAILLQERGPTTDPWVPLFPRRTLPPVLQNQLAGYRPRQEFHLNRDAISDQRLAAAFETGLRGTQRPCLMMLAAIGDRRHDAETIAAALATSTISVEQMASQLRSWALIDSRNHLTDDGWLALQRARMRPRKITFTLKQNTAPYYPMQLRGVGDV